MVVTVKITSGYIKLYVMGCIAIEAIITIEATTIIQGFIVFRKRLLYSVGQFG